MDVFDPNRREVSGPYNAIRMEGNIKGLTKVIYMFMDVHLDPTVQTECANVYSQDFNRYLAESFHELNGADRMYDFFLEIEPEWYKVDPITRATAVAEQGLAGPRHIYIHQVLQLLRSAVNYDSIKDRVNPSEVFQNVRLHYLDIRDALNPLTDDLYGLPIQADTDGIYFPQSIFQTLEWCNKSATHLVKLYRELKSNPNSRSRAAKSLFGKQIHKVLYSYKNTHIQQVITTKLDHYFKELNVLATMINQFIALLHSYLLVADSVTMTFTRDNLISAGMTPEQFVSLFSEIMTARNMLKEQVLYVGIGITDCYLLRRLLDKDYVTNAITYTGGSHTTNYIIVLTQYFDFKITHVSYSSISSIPKLNRAVRERLAKGSIITDLFVQSGRAQCTDLTGFPNRFL